MYAYFYAITKSCFHIHYTRMLMYCSVVYSVLSTLHVLYSLHYCVQYCAPLYSTASSEALICRHLSNFKYVHYTDYNAHTVVLVAPQCSSPCRAFATFIFDMTNRQCFAHLFFSLILYLISRAENRC